MIFNFFQITKMKSSKVRFSKDTKTENEEMSLDPELAAKLYEDGGFLIIKDLPEKTEFGIDMNSWNTGKCSVFFWILVIIYPQVLSFWG